MPKRKQPHGRQLSTSESRSLKHVRQTSPQQAESRSLPKSIHDLDKFTFVRIFRLCLINQHPTPIVVEEQFDWYGEPYDNEESVRLSTRFNSNDMAALLQVNSNFHEQAAPVLYGLNTFSFRGKHCWIDLIYIKSRLTDISRRNVCNVVIYFPEIERGHASELNDATIHGLRSLKSFVGLESLTLIVHEDILTGDIRPLRRFRESVPGSCRVVIDVRRAALYHKDGGWDDRPVRISSEAVRKMREWGWAMNGQWELVDRHHALRHEEDWLMWLRRNHRREIQCWFLDEPRGQFEECIFDM
ncbi:MAG: hypothetical protein LQ339_009047 [Xanthoria mediterranea]|nr:MAG: hypothetical protein LQ339_009047 [Xanthoria mediterranea]